MMSQKYLLSFLFLVLLSSTALAQSVDAKKLSRLRVSEGLRARLAERLSLFIEYELSGQYEKQYDLFATKCPAGYRCAELSREEYVKEKRTIQGDMGTLLELKFVSVGRKLQGDCAFPVLAPKFRKGQAVYSNMSLTIACLDNGEWFFRFWLVDI
jgi:hypothetical protein